MHAMSESADIETVERIIPAPAEAIFALIADPARHRDVDGSGTVVEAKGPSQELVLGSQFGMSMRLGIPYSMVNTVVEYEKDRLLAWQTRGPTPLGRFVAGRIWRYELEPVDGGTRVSESWDISQEAALGKPMVRRLRESTRRNMAATLERIETVLADEAGS